MNSGVRHQVGLEFSQIHIERSVKSQRGCDGGYNLAHDSVQVSVAGSLDSQVSAADVIDCLVVDHKGTVRVLEGGMGGQD